MRPDLLVLHGAYERDPGSIRLAYYATRGFWDRVDSPAASGWPTRARTPGSGEALSPAHLETYASPACTDLQCAAVECGWDGSPELWRCAGDFLDEWFWRPAALASLSAGRAAGVRGSLFWRGVVSETGVIVVWAALAGGFDGDALDAADEAVVAQQEPSTRVLPRFADDFAWWPGRGCSG